MCIHHPIGLDQVKWELVFDTLDDRHHLDDNDDDRKFVNHLKSLQDVRKSWFILSNYLQVFTLLESSCKYIIEN
jgi:hypothetical protein